MQYTEMIIVGGISEESAKKLDVGKSVTVQPFSSIKPKITSFLSKDEALSEVARMFVDVEPEPICFSCNIIWPGEHNDHYKEMRVPIEIDIKALDITLKLLSTKPNDSMVVFGVYFSIDDLNDNPHHRIAGYAPTRYKEHLWRNSLEVDSDMITSSRWFYGQARKHLFVDGKKAMFLKAFHQSLFGSQEQRFTEMMKCLDMLVLEEGTDIGSSDSAQGGRKDLIRIFEIRDAYVCDGIADEIADVFPRTYELLIRITRLLLDDSFDMDDCRTWGFSKTI